MDKLFQYSFQNVNFFWFLKAVTQNSLVFQIRWSISKIKIQRVKETF